MRYLKYFVVILILITVVGFVAFYRVQKLTKIDNITTTVTTDAPKTISCTRTTRLENKPQYDRALSFIQQRLNENKHMQTDNPMHYFNFFPANLVNCIKVIEETATKDNEFEGYFTFNGKDIRDNYYPVIVNSKYQSSDDVLISLLLSHELTHVQQFIDTQNNKPAISCVDSEVQAFLAQYRFYISVLNSEEMILMMGRISEAIENSKDTRFSDLNEPFGSQLLMLGAIASMRENTTCEMRESQVAGHAIKLPDQKYYDCVDSIVPIELKKLIENDNQYRKQCHLDK